MKQIEDFYKTYSTDKKEIIDNCNDLLADGYELLNYEVKYIEIENSVENSCMYYATLVKYK